MTKNIQLPLFCLFLTLFFQQNLAFSQTANMSFSAEYEMTRSKKVLKKLQDANIPGFSDKLKKDPERFLNELNITETLQVKNGLSRSYTSVREGKKTNVDDETLTYNDFASKKIYYTKKSFQGKVAIMTYDEKFQWTITKEKKIIMGYPCTKATTGEGDKLIEVWFTTLIPVSIGPDGYAGLPGLIIFKEDKTHIFTLKSISFKEEVPSISLPEVNKVISFESFRAMNMAESMKNN